MAQGPLVPQNVRDLWAKQVSRTYSAFARLSSFAQYHESEDALTLAELGLVNYEDGHKKLRHYMDFTVPIESIYENLEENGLKSNLQIALQKQLPSNYLLRGLRTWNVTLAQTVNSLPPALQRDMIAGLSQPSLAPIDNVKSLSRSNFVITGSRASASLNIWTSTLGLCFVGGYNFRDQFYKHGGSGKLYFESMTKTVEVEGATIALSKNTLKALPAVGAKTSKNTKCETGGTAVSTLPAAESNLPSTPPFDEVDFGALFDDVPCVEASLESADSESEYEDEDAALQDF